MDYLNIKLDFTCFLLDLLAISESIVHQASTIDVWKYSICFLARNSCNLFYLTKVTKVFVCESKLVLNTVY